MNTYLAKKDVIFILMLLFLFVGMIQVLVYREDTPINSVETSVGRIAYNVYGEGDKTLIAIHGSPGGKNDYDNLGPLLIEYTVYSLDMPGFGESTMSARHYGNEGASVAVLAFMDAMEIETADIVGYSWGGGVASTFAAKYPDRTEHLFLLAAVGVPESAHTQNHYTEKARYLLSAPFVMFYPGAFAPAQLDFERRHGMLRSFFDSDQRKQYELMRSIEVPTTIIHGDNDMVTLFSGALIHEDLIKDSLLFLYEGGHGEIFGDSSELARGVRYVE